MLTTTSGTPTDGRRTEEGRHRHRERVGAERRGGPCRLGRGASPTGGAVSSHPSTGLFRDIAEEQVALGNFMLSRWLLATKEGAFIDRGWKPVTRGEYERWLVEPGFSDWFFAPIPQCGPLSEQEKQLADQVFLEGLMRGMQSAEDWAFKEYGRFRFAPQTAGVNHKAAAGSAEVKSFLAPETTTDAWVKSTKAEA